MERARFRIPDLGRQSSAVDFIENSLDEYHLAFSTPPSAYDPVLGGFVVHSTPAETSLQPSPNYATVTHENAPVDPMTARFDNFTRIDTPKISPRPGPRPIEALELWDSLFPQAMEQVVRLHPREPAHLYHSDYTIRDKTSWTQVFDQVEKARNAYSNVDNRFRAGFRRVYRKFGDHVAEPLNRMTKFVPGGGDLGAVAVTPIIGCVQLLLEAARAASSVRKKAIDAFDQVESEFSDIEVFLQIYPGDENVKKASIDLIASTLFAAENVVGFFTTATWKRFFKATAQREHYEQEAIDSIADVMHKCELLLQEAKKSHMYYLVHATKVIMDRNAAVEAEMQCIRREQVRPHDIRNIMHELFDEYERRYAIYLREQKFVQQRENERIRVEFCFAAAEAVSRRSPMPTHPSGAQIGCSPASQRSITSEDLLLWIAAPELLAHDLQKITERRKVQVPEQEQVRAEQLIRTAPMREWLTAPTSSQLLVHGNYDRRAYISGLTLFCMTLTSTLAERASRFIPLIFFCGLHAEAMDVDAHTGGRAIMQSFIRQLLQSYDFGSNQMPTLHFDDKKIQLGDVGELCKLFEALVRALPSHVVLFCLVDGISYYERDEFKEDMAVVLSAILKLSDDSSVSVPVKVLVTSPTKTAEVRQPFPDHLILSMDAMARSGLVASSSRLEREMGTGLD